MSMLVCDFCLEGCCCCCGDGVKDGCCYCEPEDGGLCCCANGIDFSSDGKTSCCCCTHEGPSGKLCLKIQDLELKTVCGFEGNCCSFVLSKTLGTKSSCCGRTFFCVIFVPLCIIIFISTIIDIVIGIVMSICCCK